MNMIEKLFELFESPQTLWLFTIIALACFSAGCLSMGAVLLWRERCRRRHEWLMRKISQNRTGPERPDHQPSIWK